MEATDGEVRGSKYLRQLLLNEEAMRMCEKDPSLIKREILRTAMQATRRHTSGELYEWAMDEWDSLLDKGDIAVIASRVLAVDENGRMLRVTSPLSFLLSDGQREAVARQAALSGISR